MGFCDRRSGPKEGIDAILARMRAAIAHRGPDDAGSWTDPAGLAALAHTRLAILDLTRAGHQPMHTPEGRFTIVFNGEIYNYRELRREMQSRGCSFFTGTDTEVLLRLYEYYGAACVKKLRGMFAFAVWDAQQRRAFLVRDQFGVKPLYYTQSMGSLAFASEIRSLLASGTVERRLDPRSVQNYFETGSVPEPATLLQGVSMLPAGHTLTWENGRSRIDCYWHIEFPETRLDSAEEASCLARSALEDSLRAHFVSDVPVGLFLSGGIDSTAILALARSTGQCGELRTFSISVDDLQLDEAPVAEQTARHFGASHTTFRLDGPTAMAALPEYLCAMDVPSIDGLNTWIISRLARHNGMKVVLSGLGGDELLGGYPSYGRIPRLTKMARCLGGSLPLRRIAGAMLERLGCRSRWRRLGDFLRGPPTLSRAYNAYRGVFAPREARRLAAHLSGACEAELAPPAEDADPSLPPHNGDAVSYLELSRYMRNQLLRNSDVMSMAHGLELRVPFVDRMLFETLATIPPSIRLRPGKRLLLDAVPEIPQQVARAPKRGFAFPFDKWLAADLPVGMGIGATRLPVATNTWYQRWSVFMFQEWRGRVLGAFDS